MTTEQATRQAIVAAVRAFVERVDRRAKESYMQAGIPSAGGLYKASMYAELAALERTVAADGEEAESRRVIDRSGFTVGEEA